ncbi:DEAD/DEAH box helicase [Halomonas sp. PR-M31]|uniref:DEAD/DEAH box helicase n=1 Tax=Halomonas sp. PR-M31 TaxID=1471202 RepID=UPI000A977186|nr:DEAD/DEAH box helicase [Halomonas sp. PR-M31]
MIPALRELAGGRDTQLGFKDAQRAFKVARAKVEHILEELERLQELKRQAKQIQAQRDLIERYRLEAARLELWSVKRQARRVGVWPFKHYLAHRMLLRRLRQKQHRAEKTAALSKQRADALERQLEKARKENAHLCERYSDALLPDEALDLEVPDIQRTSFGHCQVLNQARAQLTARAFELHQAWLVAAYDDKSQRLHKTLFSLMPTINGSVLDRDAAKALWQMLFMIVPVISSTFASVASQFRALKEAEIGWLFVDEAGQATPQQAVGALWRAKRAVVVGDPLQIEPVFTVPPELVDTLAKGEFADEWYQWSPTVTSVQTVADRANPYGTYQIADDLWVGSPLRVHRRCDEPMFGIANAIAYNGKMLHGNSKLSDGPGNSRWINVAGQVSGKHFVLRQAKCVHKILLQYIEREKEPPPVYIISPFKAVASGIRHYLGQHLSGEWFGGQNKLHSWLKERVGTVHTFQGKQEERVILVLGLSEDNPGAVEWAASKPNLLNVALTRAKKRIYVVGSVDIWAGKRYFSEAYEQLPVISNSSDVLDTRGDSGRLE